MGSLNKETAVEAAKIGGVVGFDGKDAEYTDYNAISKVYDKSRIPTGVHVYLGAMALNKKPICQQDHLDVGCGTGTFLRALAGKVGSFTGMDYNEGMLSQAKKNLIEAGFAEPKLLQGSADALPFPDASFDFATMNQVNHHFPNDDNFAFLGRACKEVFRVLRSGGAWTINMSTDEQIIDGFWWNDRDFFPKSLAGIEKRAPPMEVFQAHLKAAGFEIRQDSVMTPLHATLMSPEVYGVRKYDAAFDPMYRAQDSSWGAIEDAGELEGGLEKLKKIIADGKADAWWDKREELRKSVGQATLLTVWKP